MQVLGDDTEMHPLHNPESNSSTTSFTVNVDQPLVVRNPEMSLATFTEPDFLRPPQAVTPYEPYPGSLPPNFNYHPHTPTPEVVEEPEVIPGDDWLHNVKGLSP
jgi:hypothetical protein